VVKIAICGYSNTRQQIPVNNPSYKIWGMNHRLDSHPSRMDLHFDIHDTKRYNEDHPYYQFIKNNKDKSILNGLDERFTDCKIYPKNAIIEKYGSYFTCSASWMIAYAIEQNPSDIAIFGIDCATVDEYINQRASILYFLGIAVGKGIKLHYPPECKLFNGNIYYNG